MRVSDEQARDMATWSDNAIIGRIGSDLAADLLDARADAAVMAEQAQRHLAEIGRLRERVARLEAAPKGARAMQWQARYGERVVALFVDVSVAEQLTRGLDETGIVVERALSSTVPAPDVLTTARESGATLHVLPTRANVRARVEEQAHTLLADALIEATSGPQLAPGESVDAFKARFMEHAEAQARRDAELRESGVRAGLEVAAKIVAASHEIPSLLRGGIAKDIRSLATDPARVAEIAQSVKP